MLDSAKLCYTSHLKQARKILEKLSFSNKLRSCFRRKTTSDSTWLSSSFAAMEVSAQLKQVFEFIDTNGDGKLSPLELKKVILRLEGHEKAEGIVREMDFNEDGFVDLDEFMVVVGNDDDEEEDSSTVTMEAFKVFDGDNNGLISAEELQSVLARLGCGKCSVGECKKMIRGVDRDGDGFVNFDEFKIMLSAGY